jgi:DNA-binding MarR family transcriptional regulator
LTAAYDEAMRPNGLTVTQFTVLQALSLTGELIQGQLGDVLAIDTTTLTRSLRLMTQAGWVERRPGKDRREWRWRLTAVGRETFKTASPAWEQAQREVRRRLGEKDWSASFDVSEGIVSAMQITGGKK